MSVNIYYISRQLTLISSIYIYLHISIFNLLNQFFSTILLLQQIMAKPRTQQDTPKSSQVSPTVVTIKPRKKPNKSWNKDELLQLANDLDEENASKNLEIVSLNRELQLQKNENKSLKDELKDMREQLNEIKQMMKAQKFNDRLVEVERRLYAQEQYSRRECIELHGFEDVANENVEDAAIAVLNATADNGYEYKTSDFHAIHKLKNTNIVIMKSVNRRTVLGALRNRKRLKDLSDGQKKSLREKKVGHRIYINESLCPYYRNLFGKCNALFKKGLVKNFFTINGTIKITDNLDKKLTIGHLHDLESHFGSEIIDAIKLQKQQ